VAVQVVDAQRRAAPAQVIRGGAQDAPVRRQLTRHQAGIVQRAIAQRQLHAFAHQVHQFVAQGQVDANPGMRLLEAAHRRHHMTAPESVGRGELEHAGHHILALLQRRLGRFHRIQHAAAVQVEQAALIGERGAPRAAVQQPHLHAPLQGGEALADHGERDPQVAGGGGQAAAMHDAVEGTQLVEVVDHADVSSLARVPFPYCHYGNSCTSTQWSHSCQPRKGRPHSASTLPRQDSRHAEPQPPAR